MVTVGVGGRDPKYHTQNPFLNISMEHVVSQLSRPCNTRLTNIAGPLRYHKNVPSWIRSTGSKGRLVWTLSSIYLLSHHGWTPKTLKNNYFNFSVPFLQNKKNKFRLPGRADPYLKDEPNQKMIWSLAPNNFPTTSTVDSRQLTSRDWIRDLHNLNCCYDDWHYLNSRNVGTLTIVDLDWCPNSDRSLSWLRSLDNGCCKWFGPYTWKRIATFTIKNSEDLH